MTASTLFAPEVGTALSLLERTRDWAENPPTPHSAASLELMVVGALQQARGLQLAWSLCMQEEEVWEMEWFRQRIRSMEFLAGTVSEIVARTMEILWRLQKENPEWVPPAMAAELESGSKAVDEVTAKVRKARQWLDRPRPPANEEMIRRSQASLARNEGEDITDVINRLKNGGSLV
jgi:hypothetical protein